MMKSFKELLVTIAVVSASFQIPSMGAATVTASKNYVDRNTTLHPYSNGIDHVGYFLGSQTNKVLASKEYVDNSMSESSPGDYLNVSNKAYLARSKTDLAVYATETTPWRCSGVNASGEYAAMTNLSLWTFTTWEGSGQTYPTIWYEGVVIGDCNSPMPDEDMQTATMWPMFFDDDLYVTFVRSVAGQDTGNRIATANDIPFSVTVVAPSTNAASGAAADAKTTGTALYTGFTEWEFSGSGYDPSHKYKVEAPMEDGDRWDFYLSRDGTLIDDSYSDTDEPTKLVFTISQITATRRLVTPTKTSQLENDGPKDGLNVGHPFATTDQIPAPVDISGKLDGAAAYPAWMAGSYGEDSIVSHNGRLWKCILSTTVEPSDSLGGDWVSVTINSLKMDALTAAQTNAVNSGVTSAKVASWDGYAALIASKVSTNALANKPVYDFSKNYDIIRATADIVQLLGGTVTNNPTANQGGN